MNTEQNSTTRPARGAGQARGWSALEAALVTAGLVLAVGLRSFEPIWEVGRGLLVLGILAGVAYLVGRTARQRAARRDAFHALVVTLVVSQPVLLALRALDLPASRIVLAGELLVLFVAIAVAGSRPRPLRLAMFGAFAAVAAAPTLLGLVGSSPGTVEADGASHRYVFTSYHDLRITQHEILPHETQEGGALTLLPDGRLLLVSGSGAGRIIEMSGDGDLIHTESIELGLPIDVAAYLETGRYQPEFYRVFDAMYADGHLFVTHILWDEPGECYALRLIEAAFDGTTVGAWNVRFETRPCVPLPYTYNTSGGRLAALDARHLLLSVGTFGIDQVAIEDASFAGWREDSDYGKIFVLDTKTWEHSVFTKGHRNPEGLLVTDERIWSTEHGPHGGDELNLVEEGTDYGWPFASYGTDYGRKTLELGGVPGDHSEYTRPVYAWIPSIGISNLIRVEGSRFPLWEGDLLVGSLSGLGNGHALFRVRLREGRVISTERIPVDGRVRDLVQIAGGGLIVLWDSDGSIRVVRPADHVFAQCAGCHNVRNAQHAIGPDLYGVVGKRVAGHQNYDYSEAMRSFGGSWTPERLDRFLMAPQAEVPGTSMEHDGVRDPVERAEIIQYLSEVSAGRPLP